MTQRDTTPDAEVRACREVITRLLKIAEGRGADEDGYFRLHVSELRGAERVLDRFEEGRARNPFKLARSGS